MKRTNYNELESWHLGRIAAGEAEEIGAIDSYEDETGFMWFITKIDVNKYDLTTEVDPFAFADGKIDGNGNPVIIYHN